MTRPPRAWPIWPLLPVLMAVVALVYQPVWLGGLLWDDDHHVTRLALQSLHGLWRIWTEPGAAQQYYPVAHSAFWLQHRLWGDEVLGYHLVNVGLHAISAFLLALILRRLRVPGAIVAAAIFALHPVNVESVAWISELKNTLSTVCYLGAALLYLRFAETRRGSAYAGALLLFVLALWSKSVTATLPAALLIVCWWQRGRNGWRRDVVPLLPLFAIGLAAGLFTAWVERHYIGAQGAEFHLTLIERGLLAGRAVWFYLGSLVWPAGLVFVYPRWQISQGVWWQYLFPVAAALVLLAFWMVRERSRAPLAAFLLFGVALAPALGFVDVFPFRYSFVADHFQYLATIPFAACAGAAAVLLLRRTRFDSPASGIVAAILIGAPLALAANRHAADFVSAETLYRATLARNPDAWMAHNNLATILMAVGRAGEAREQFMESLRLDPEVLETQLNVGRLLIDEGALPEAVEHLREAIRLGPGRADAHSNLGVALLRQGNTTGAVAEFEEALSRDPALAQAHTNLVAVHQQLGVAEAQAGRLPQAIRHFEAAVREAPQDAAIRYNLGTAYLASGRPREAVVQLREALRLNPALTAARDNLAAAQQQGAR